MSRTSSDMSKHTPGPWRLSYYRQGGDKAALPVRISIEAGKADTPSALVIADLPLCDKHREANARLIAQAPAMYDYLHTIAFSGALFADDQDPCMIACNHNECKLTEQARAILRAIDSNVDTYANSI